jgi:DNA mismatch endonuclease (patch repair protein)
MAYESWASSENIRKTMLGNRRRDTKPELAVRRALHARGLRYRVDLAPLAGYRRRADVVFTRRRIAVFIDGCFWHGCPLHYRAPGTNAGYWQPKIARNVERDAETTLALVNAGWRVLRYWEHEPASEIVDDIVRELSLTECELPQGQ